MDTLKNLFGKKEPEPLQVAPEPLLYDDEVLDYNEEPPISSFTEIGGSPVPGLTLSQVVRGHTAYITRIAWAPDGKRLASPSADGTIRIWNIIRVY